jgi:hypothetical protein
VGLKLAAAGVLSVLLLASTAGAADAPPLSLGRATATVPRCTPATDRDFGSCPQLATVDFRIAVPSDGFGGGIVSCAYNGAKTLADATKRLLAGVKEIEAGRDQELSDCRISAALSPGEPTAGTAETGTFAALAYFPNANRDGFVHSNVVHYTVTDECRLTVTRGFVRKSPHPGFLPGRPFPCGGPLPLDNLALRSPFGDRVDLHGCGYLADRSLPSHLYLGISLVGTSRATPESNCAPHGTLRPGSLEIDTAKRGLARYVLSISANWGKIFVADAPAKVVVTYDDRHTTLRVLHGSAILARRTANEKRDGPGGFNAKVVVESCRPKSSSDCILRAFERAYKSDGATVVRAGRSSTTTGGRLPTPPR